MCRGNLRPQNKFSGRFFNLPLQSTSSASYRHTHTHIPVGVRVIMFSMMVHSPAQSTRPFTEVIPSRRQHCKLLDAMTMLGRYASGCVRLRCSGWWCVSWTNHHHNILLPITAVASKPEQWKLRKEINGVGVRRYAGQYWGFQSYQTYVSVSLLACVCVRVWCIRIKIWPLWRQTVSLQSWTETSGYFGIRDNRYFAIVKPHRYTMYNVCKEILSTNRIMSGAVKYIDILYSINTIRNGSNSNPYIWC